MTGRVRAAALGAVAALAVACGSTAVESERAAAKAAAAPEYLIEDFMATTRIGGASFSPDGRKLVFHGNQTGVFNLYEVSADGGTPKALTASTDNAIASIGFFPQ